MKKCRITVMKVARYDDLIEKYENPIEHACDMKEGQVFIANGWERLRASVSALGRACPPLCWRCPTAAGISMTAG